MSLSRLVFLRLQPDNVARWIIGAIGLGAGLTMLAVPLLAHVGLRSALEETEQVLTGDQAAVVSIRRGAPLSPQAIEMAGALEARTAAVLPLERAGDSAGAVVVHDAPEWAVAPALAGGSGWTIQGKAEVEVPAEAEVDDTLGHGLAVRAPIVAMEALLGSAAPNLLLGSSAIVANIDQVALRQAGAIALPPEAGYLVYEAEPLPSLLLMVGAFTLIISLVLLANMTIVGLEGRREDLASLSALGASDHQLAKAVGLEWGLVGLVGGIGAAWASSMASSMVMGDMAGSLERSTGAFLQLDPGPVSWATIVAIGAAIGAGTGYVMGRLSLRATGSTADRDHRPRIARTLPLAGGLVTLGSVAVALTFVARWRSSSRAWQPLVGLIGFTANSLFFDLAVALLVPVVLLAINWALIRSGRLSLGVLLNASDARGAMILGLAVCAAVGVGAFLGSFLPAVENQVAADLSTDPGRTLHFAPAHPSRSLGIAPDLRTTVAQDVVEKTCQSGQSASAEWSAQLRDDHGDFVASSRGPLCTTPADVAALPTGVDTSEATVGSRFARERRLDLGDKFDLVGEAGMASVRIDKIREIGPFRSATVEVAPAVLFAVTGNPTVDLIAVDAPSSGGAVADNSAVEIANAVTAQSALLQPFRRLQVLMMGLALVVSFAATSLLVQSRRSDFAVLDALGTPPLANHGRLAVGAAVVSATAAAFGCVVSVFGYVSARNIGGLLIGIRPPFALSMSAYARSSAFGIAAGVLGAVAASVLIGYLSPRTVGE